MVCATLGRSRATRQNFPEGAVQEFKTYLAQYPAEYGLYMGGLVTVATKSGTNSIHGELFEYWRNEALNRDNEFQRQARAARTHRKSLQPQPVWWRRRRPSHQEPHALLFRVRARADHQFLHHFYLIASVLRLEPGHVQAAAHGPDAHRAPRLPDQQQSIRFPAVRAGVEQADLPGLRRRRRRFLLRRPASSPFHRRRAHLDANSQHRK